VSVTRKFNFLFLSALLACVALACLPGEPAPATFTLAFAGDVMLGRGVAQALAGNWEAAFAQVRPWLAEADLAFANLESPLTTMPQIASGYDLRAAPQAITALHAAGFDIMSLANNHALDAGEAGRAETGATLSAAGIAGVVERETGHLVSRQAPYPSLVYELLAFDDSTVPLDLEAASCMVAAAKEEADLIIVSAHWGGEYQAAPSPHQQSIAQALARAGADLIIGHGPHVLQPVERVGQTLVAYSLGNLLFDQPYPADCRWGLVLRITRLARGKQLAVELLPTIVERGRVRFASPQEAPAILARLTPDRRTD
jgi:poly-gamma-glutamate capsule biosynthesis protein CapA/YwtB (metallophosphatase superfamily)